jgi:DNA polymerase alpha subunit A
MDNKRNIINKTLEVKKGAKSRIDQIEDKFEEEKKNMQDDIDESVEDFIEKDFYQDERMYKNQKKKLKTNPKVYKPKANTTNQNEEEKKKYEMETKNIMDNLVKKSQKTNIPKSQNLDDALKSLQNNYKKIEIKHKRENEIIVKKELLMASLKMEHDNILDKMENSRETLNFFLTEIIPDNKNSSIIYLFGKSKKQDTFINTCVKVKDLKREIYIMPKREATAEEVIGEIESLIKNSKEGKLDYQMEIVKKKYCFELDVDYRNEEVDVVKLSYSFDKKALTSIKQIGNKYKGVFGLNYNPIEIFMLRNKILGSCWLDIGNYVVYENNKFAPNFLNVEISEIDSNVTMSVDNSITPLFNICTFEINYDHSFNEIDAICYSFYTEYNINTSGYKTVDKIIFQKNTIQTNVKHQENNQSQLVIKEFENEYQLLANFQIVFSNTDPDIVIGHELLSYTLEVYLQRLRNKLLDFDHFSRITTNKTKSKNSDNIKYKLRSLFPGRLFVDIYELAKTSIKLESYSLADMITHFYGVINQNSDLIKNMTENSTNVLKICDKLQILPLTLQLSKVAGCLWEMSLRQSRAERNEVLLLNEFYHKNYIIPDNQKSNNSFSKKSKSKYLGGKVFDPIVNFYNSYIILVDFNSLYPSIIRQFKICFTTVKRNLIEPGYESAENEEVDDIELNEDFEMTLNHIESSSQNEPLLPVVLSRLINKRKMVKNDIRKLTSTPNYSKEVEIQLDIKQQAYKLIANSIYGCLGFSHSRFYSKKMAMLVTSFGRKLLQSSRDLIERLGYEVIYGDTDSLMINTREKHIKKALLEGFKIKKEINTQFHKKKGEEQILEVEIDGVYKKLLLLKKKKYAGLMITNYNEIVKSRNPIPEEEKLEIKGLDMVRRDWSPLTKEICKVVLDLIMQKDGDLIEIYSYLEKMNTALDNFENVANPKENDSLAVKVGDFIIKRQLNKKTNEYGQSSNLPHVKVALDMKKLFNKKEEQLVNHFIPFIICKEGESLYDKAYHPTVYMADLNSDHPKHIDIEYYKKNQIIAPLERILSPIEGFNMEILNKSFGFFVEETPVNKDYKTFNDYYDIVKDKTSLNYRTIDLDFQDYNQKCVYCKSYCPSFLTYCKEQKFENEEIENRVLKTISFIINKYNSNKYLCENCDFECKMILVSKVCPKCKNNSIKKKYDNRQVIAKLLYYSELWKHTKELNMNGYENNVINTFLKDIDKILKVFDYECKDVLKIFKIFNQQYSKKNDLTIKLINL